MSKTASTILLFINICITEQTLYDVITDDMRKIYIQISKENKYVESFVNGVFKWTVGCDGWVMSVVWRMVAFQKTSSMESWH